MDFISQPNIYGFLFFRFDLPFLIILYFLRVWIIPSLFAPNSQEMLIHLSISQIDIKVISVLFSLKRTFIDNYFYSKNNIHLF